MTSDTIHTQPLAVSKITFVMIVLMPIAFLLSLSLLKAYTGGDQVIYRSLYEKLVGSSLGEMPSIILLESGSVEQFTGLILWIGANLGIDKDIFISGLNTALITALVILLLRHKTPWHIVIMLLTNFYFLVLLTSAERLKVAYIVLILSALFSGKTRYLLLCLSPFAHIKSVIILISIFVATKARTLTDSIFHLKASKREFLVILGVFLTGALTFLAIGDGISLKATAYIEQKNSNIDMINMLLLSIVAILATRKRLRMALALTPLFALSSLLSEGGGVNMLATTVVFFLLLTERRLNHPLVHTIMFYFSIKSIPYIYSIYAYGDGFINQPKLTDYLFTP